MPILYDGAARRNLSHPQTLGMRCLLAPLRLGLFRWPSLHLDRPVDCAYKEEACQESDGAS
jgi:hypothetical protein